jgi:hypothetical protein
MVLTFVLASASTYLGGILVRYQFPSTRKTLDNWALAVLCLVTVPGFTVLLFMIGKYSLFPLEGVVEMNKYGCCTQALVFPRTEVPQLAGYLRERGHGQTDTMIEEYSDQKGKQRLALGKQVVQHVGLKSECLLGNLMIFRIQCVAEIAAAPTIPVRWQERVEELAIQVILYPGMLIFF